MGEEKSLEQLKKEAAEKAKAAALARRQAKEQGAEAEVESAGEEEDLAKKKAAAAAAAKAAALARKQAKEQSVEAEAGPAGEEDLAKKKAAAAAAAKAAALARKQAKEQSVEAEPGSAGEEDLAKKKAAAAAAAKAAALARKQAKEQSVEAEAGPAGEEDLAKKKAAAVAKAKAAALAKMEAKEKEGEATDGGDLEKKKAIAAAKAKAAAAARAKATLSGNLEEEPTAEVPNQPLLDKYVNVIENHLGKEVLEESYINKLSKDVPTLVAKPDTYSKIAEFLKYNEQLAFNYLSELHGTDFETHMEIYIHLYSFNKRQAVALKVKIDRNRPEIPSLVRLWEGANWPECEAYDLLGIKFTGHPDLKRIMLGEDWIGHPLRKDYEPYDVEV